MTLFKDAYKFFKDIVPDDSARQISALHQVETRVNFSNIRKVVDLGCGMGDSFDYFKEKKPDIEWIGVDIENSPEVNERQRTDATFMTFDGVHLPFKDNEIDLIYCHQVLEHVRSPEKLLEEVRRVLSPDGFFIGATSHLEPYHSYSYWNFTPYGFLALIQESGLTLKEMRPGADGMTLFIRKVLGKPRILNWFLAHETPMNGIIGIYGFLCGKNKKEINMLKLMFCGHFIFMVQKNGVT